jgi:hypothetical protein
VVERGEGNDDNGSQPTEGQGTVDRGRGEECDGLTEFQSVEKLSPPTLPLRIENGSGGSTKPTQSGPTESELEGTKKNSVHP